MSDGQNESWADTCGKATLEPSYVQFPLCLFPLTKNVGPPSTSSASPTGANNIPRSIYMDGTKCFGCMEMESDSPDL